MRELGECGARPAKGRLPILLGEPVTHCPTAMGLQDETVLRLAALCPGPNGDDEARDIGLHELPPRYRAAVGMAREWVRIDERRKADAR